jgi:hypothetical protein
MPAWDPAVANYVAGVYGISYADSLGYLRCSYHPEMQKKSFCIVDGFIVTAATSL